MIAIRRWVIPAIGSADRSGPPGPNGWKLADGSGDGRFLELVGGVLGRRRVGPANIPASVSYPIRACQLAVE